MTTKVQGSQGIEFPDSTQQGSAGISQVNADTRYVNVAGDTMTGTLQVPSVSVSNRVLITSDVEDLLILRRATPGNMNYLSFQSSAQSVTGYVGHGSSTSQALMMSCGNGLSLLSGSGHAFNTIDNLARAWLDTAGNFSAIGSITPNASDVRLKENIVPINDPLGRLNRINGRDFTWKDGGKADTGFIAQELRDVFPQLITESLVGKTETENPGYLGVALGNQITALLVEAVKELSTKLDTALARIAELEAK